jgi:hypothetical protein
VGLGLSIGSVGAWLLLILWLCVDWFNNQEMPMLKSVQSVAKFGLNAVGVLRGQSGEDSGHATGTM